MQISLSSGKNSNNYSHSELLRPEGNAMPDGRVRKKKAGASSDAKNDPKNTVQSLAKGFRVLAAAAAAGLDSAIATAQAAHRDDTDRPRCAARPARSR